jgi:hypothetical protein
MAKDFELNSSNIISDVGNGISCDTNSDFGGDLANDAGVDLNAGALVAKAASMEALPADMNHYSIPNDDRPAYICETPPDAVKSPEDIDLFDYFENAGDGFREIQERENMVNEAEETENALTRPEAADHCDPPEQPEETT